MVHFLLVNIALTYINWPKLLSENTCGLIGGCSSNGRALALHVRGTGIDPRQLHICFFYLPLSSTRSTLHTFMATFFSIRYCTEPVQTDSLSDRQTHRHTDTYIHTYAQTHRQTGTQTYRHTDTHESDCCGHPFRVSGVFPSTYHQGSAQYPPYENNLLFS